MRILLGLMAAAACLAAQQPVSGGAPVAGIVTLEQAVQEAIAGNLDLAAERYNISVAEARQITARLRPNPVMTIAGDHLDLLGTGYNSINNGGPNEYAVRTDFVLERGGKRNARIALAAADKALADLGFRDALRRLIFDVQSAFVEVQIAKEYLALALNGIVEINAARVKSGDLAPVELSRSQVAALQYQAAVTQAELQVRQARYRLQQLMGRTNPTEEFDVTGPIRRDAQRADPDEIRARAERERPDLLALRQSESRNQADLRLQIAQGRIDYTVGTEYRRQEAVSGRGNSLGLFFSAPLPVFNRNQGEIARAEREVNQAAARIRALENSVRTEALTAWQAYTTSRRLLTDIETNMLAKARDVRQTTEYSYRRGEASLVEFLDAQRAFNDATQSYNEARGLYARSLYQIDAVTAAAVTETLSHGSAAPLRK